MSGGCGHRERRFCTSRGIWVIRICLWGPGEGWFGCSQRWEAPTCLLASTTSGSRGSSASSACSSWRAVSRRDLSTESTTNTNTWASLRYSGQYARRLWLPPTVGDGQRQCRSGGTRVCCVPTGGRGALPSSRSISSPSTCSWAELKPSVGGMRVLAFWLQM